ncbi:MAG TPA: endolytic transglycosylase MltG [bacterium]|nr:endolytic transglycosylase MltG [bacterium]
MKQFIIIIFISLLGVLYVWQGIYLPKDSYSQEEKIFLINKGEGIEEIAQHLEEEGIIKNKALFLLYLILTRQLRNIQAGAYQLSPSMSIDEIVDKLVCGKTLKEKITIIEGWRARDIALYLGKKGICTPEEFLEVVDFPKTKHSSKAMDFSDKYNFLEDKPKNVDLEGYLFPDTYFIERDMTPEEIVEMMLDNFGKKLTPELRKEIARQGKTIFEIVTMASLLEKEVKSLEDKKLVAGILWKRLKIGIPLQVDATITYITGKKTTFISKKETEIDSPYNTYKYKGLPPAPICNPGFESILASIYYKDSEYLYYLSAPDGRTIFSRTLEEHNIAKAKYLKNNN